MMKDIILTFISIASSTIFLLFTVCIGWFIVWKLFLSRFKFVRELLGGICENANVNEVNSGKPRVKKQRRD